MRSTSQRTAKPLSPWVLVLFAALFWGVLIDWTAPLTELHDFRQSQTAFSSYWMLRDGLDFLRPALPLFGPAQPSVPLEFPFYQSLLVYFARLVGHYDVATVILGGRIMAFASFLLAARALYALVVRIHDSRLATMATGLFLLMPFGALWSSAVMIEFFVLALTISYIAAVCRIAVEPRPGWPIVLWAAVAGSLAVLGKITTVLVYEPALVWLWLLWIGRERKQDDMLTPRDLIRIVATTVAVGIFPLAVGYAWVSWTDHIKSASPLTYFLTSAGSADWTYGTWHDRLSLALWTKIGGYWGIQIFGAVGIPLAAIGLWQLWRRDWRWAVFWILPPVIAPLVFFSLYQHHNYYHIAILPSLIVLLANGALHLSNRLRTAWSQPQRDLTTAASLIVLAWICFTLQIAFPHYRAPREMLSSLRIGPVVNSPTRQRDMEMVRLIRKNSKPDDFVMIAKEDWSSIVALYAERRALMIESCGDLAGQPRLGLYVVDRRRTLCKTMDVPSACRLSDRDDLVAGTCVRVNR